MHLEGVGRRLAKRKRWLGVLFISPMEGKVMPMIHRGDLESILRDVVANCDAEVLVKLYNSLPDRIRENIRFNWDIPEYLEVEQVKE